MERAIEAAVADLKKKANSDWRGGRVVRGVTVVERLPMYGFYASPFPFARVSLWRPQDVSIVATALQVCLAVSYLLPTSPVGGANCGGACPGWHSRKSDAAI